MKTPKIRFKHDDGSPFTPWEQKTIQELFRKVTEKNDLTYGKESIISVANMYFRTDTGADTLEDAYLRTYTVMRYGDIAYEGNKSKSYAHGRFVANTIGDGIVSHVFDVYRPITDYIIGYWKEYINFEPIMGRILAKCTKATTMMSTLVTNDFLNQTVNVPSLAEQQKIADFLSAVDEVIRAAAEDVRLWEERKRGVMQKLFSQEVRFKDENGDEYPEWEEQPLNDEYESMGNNTLSRAELSNEEGQVFNIHYGDILTVFGAYVEVDRTVLPRIISDSNAQKALKYALKNGDVILADTAEDEAVGKAIEIVLTGDSEIVAGLHTIAIRPKRAYASRFLGYYFNSNAYRRQLYPLMQGIKVTSISKSALMETTVQIPHIAEQQKIADALTAIDEVITLKKQKLHHWQQLKKGLLQQMFV